MSCKDIYIRSNVFVIVKDSSGNIIAQYFNNRNKCRSQFNIELTNIHNVPMDQLGNIQVFVDGKRIR
jgi:hypothetical protein